MLPVELVASAMPLVVQYGNAVRRDLSIVCRQLSIADAMLFDADWCWCGGAAVLF